MSTATPHASGGPSRGLGTRTSAAPRASRGPLRGPGIRASGPRSSTGHVAMGDRCDDRAHSSPKNRSKPTSRVVGWPRGYGSPLLVGLRPVAAYSRRLRHKDPKTRDRGGEINCLF